jgi:uncharacterized protein YukE
MKQMREATHGTVLEMDLLQIAFRSISLGNIDLNKLPALMEQLEHRSKLLGIGTRELFDQFIRGAETGSKRFQVQFGLLYDVRKAEQDYAASIHTTIENLSDEEKRVVLVGKAFEEMSKQQKSTNSEAEKALEASERITTAFDEAKRAIGDLVGTPLLKFLSSIALEAAIAAEAMVTVVKAFIAIQQAASFQFFDARETIKEISSLGDAIRKQTTEIGELWTGAAHTVDTAKKDITTPPKTPEHVTTEKELEARNKLLKEQNDLIKKEAEERTKLIAKVFPNISKESEMVAEQIALYFKLGDAVYAALAAKERQASKFFQYPKQMDVPEVKPLPEQEKLSGMSFERSLEFFRGKDFAKNVGTGIDVLTAGFSRLGDTIARDFVDKIIGATSLFQQFVGEVIGGIIRIAEQIAESAIIAGILSLFGLPFGSIFSKLSPIAFAGGGVINEPVAGIGLQSRRGYSFAENMPERVSPLTSFGRSSEPMVIKIEGDFRASGRDMISSFKLARIIDRKSGGNL